MTEVVCQHHAHWSEQRVSCLPWPGLKPPEAQLELCSRQPGEPWGCSWTGVPTLFLFVSETVLFLGMRQLGL